MRFRAKFAAFVGRAARWGGETFMHRAAGNLPGAITLKLDPLVLPELVDGISPIAVISGTNGKTTTTNLIADCLATSGAPLYCNRDGNNLQSGVVTTLLVAPEQRERATGQGSNAAFDGAPLAIPDQPIACFECDELYTRYVLPRTRPRMFILLNLFRDQLDRFGEIDHTQDVIAEALAQTPDTLYVYNGDDPLCAAIADRVPNRSLAFGISESLGLSADRVSDSRFCQKCGGALEYEYVHYSQLGAYRCAECGWQRPDLAFSATDVHASEHGFEFFIDGRRVRTGQSGVYMVYNVLAAYAAAKLSGMVAFDSFQRCVLDYTPTNGRLQTFDLGERKVMTNLAKNPTGFNQNIRIVLQERGRVLSLFVNDNDADGHDVSWFFDIDFERWASIEGLKAFVGGTRANDMQVRLKYAGIRAQVVETVADVLAATEAADGKVYVIANYTALPAVRSELQDMEKRARQGAAPASEPAANQACAPAPAPTPEPPTPAPAPAPAPAAVSSQPAARALRPLTIVHLFPELLNLYGDGGNVIALRRRLEWRGLPVRVVEAGMGAAIDFAEADIVFIGGGADREQMIVKDAMAACKQELSAYVADGGVLLAVCGGYQFLGHSYAMDDVVVEGLGIVDIETVRGQGRLIGNAVIQSDIADVPIVGFENHGGRTTLGPGVQPLGRVLGSTFGNNGEDGFEGVHHNNLIGTYLHGPLLPKNPQVADHLITCAYERRGCAVELVPLADAEEHEANSIMAHRLGVS